MKIVQNLEEFSEKTSGHPVYVNLLNVYKNGILISLEFYFTKLCFLSAYFQR